MNQFILICLLLTMPFLLVAKEYQPDDESSLTEYQVPEWYQDAKFGIWAHWGAYSVPAFRGTHAGEWYPRHMYERENDESGFFEFHSQLYGDPAEFGYKDLINQFTAKKFNADQWMDLATEAGAKFYTVVAMHHDGFAMYDSQHTRWNAKNMGPKRDITGELVRAARERDLKVGVSNHFAFNLEYYDRNHQQGGDASPENYDLYGHGGKVDDWYMKRWWNISTELVDKYQPDLYYFDWGWNKWPEFDEQRPRFLSYFYNKSIEFGKGTYGSPGVVLNYKNKRKLPMGSAVQTIERGRLNHIRDMAWQTDTSISVHSWGYAENDQYWSTNELVDQLVDIVSKNGVVMLNFGPKGDGSIPKVYADKLRGIGQWLKVNGEAIYQTRPYEIYGEGPTKLTKTNRENVQTNGYHFNAQDIRFTRNKANDTLFITSLDLPDDSILVKSLNSLQFNAQTLTHLTLVANGTELTWSQNEQGLKIIMPKNLLGQYALTIKAKFSGQIPQITSLLTNHRKP